MASFDPSKRVPHTEILRSAEKKKSSKSGCAKKAIGVLWSEQLGVILGFFGAGGQVTVSGILNLSALGVEHALVETPTLSKSRPSIFEQSLELAEELTEGKSSLAEDAGGLVFLQLALLCFLLVFVVLVLGLADGAIWRSKDRKLFFLVVVEIAVGSTKHSW